MNNNENTVDGASHDTILYNSESELKSVDNIIQESNVEKSENVVTPKIERIVIDLKDETSDEDDYGKNYIKKCSFNDQKKPIEPNNNLSSFFNGKKEPFYPMEEMQDHDDTSTSSVDSELKSVENIVQESNAEKSEIDDNISLIAKKRKHDNNIVNDDDDDDDCLKFANEEHNVEVLTDAKNSIEILTDNSNDLCNLKSDTNVAQKSYFIECDAKNIDDTLYNSFIK